MADDTIRHHYAPPMRRRIVMPDPKNAVMTFAAVEAKP